VPSPNCTAKGATGCSTTVLPLPGPHSGPGPASPRRPDGLLIRPPTWATLGGRRARAPGWFLYVPRRACYHQLSRPVAQALRQVRIPWSENRRPRAPRNFRSMRTRTCLADPCRRAAGWRSARCALAWPCVCWPSRSPLARGEAMGPAGLLLRYRRVAVPRPTREAFRCGLT
jgi:hypothetical protein